MAQRTNPRGRVAVTAAKVIGSVVTLYVVGLAITSLFGLQVLPSVLVPQFNSDSPRASPEVPVAEGSDAGVHWRLTVNTVGPKPCMRAYTDTAINPGQCGFRDFGQIEDYGPSVAQLNNGPFLYFGPLPPGTAAVVIEQHDGTRQRVTARTEPVNKVIYFHMLCDQRAEDVVPVDASEHAVPVPEIP